MQKFTAIFVVIMFLMILQMIWLYISELAGKDIGALVFAKFILYGTPTLIPITVPLSILFTSIMVFGEFSEHFEFVAMKSNGISLQRAMRSLTVFILILSLATFYSTNTLIPVSYKKFRNLKENIIKLKPAQVIMPKQFNQIGDDINMKIDRKYGDNDQYLENVIIHKKHPSKSGNYTVIKSKKGELVSAKNSNVLSLILQEGNYYDEIQSKNYKKRQKLPFVKTKFEEYAINLDLTAFNDVDMSAENYTRNRKMLNLKALRKDIDSFSVTFNKNRVAFSDRMDRRLGYYTLVNNLNKEASLNCITTTYPNSLLDIFDIETRAAITDQAVNNLERVQSLTNQEKDTIKREVTTLNKFEVALHEKFALGFACVVLFFIGAPLGVIMRKGGLGLPLVISICFFLTYYFIGIFAKNSSDDGSISPFMASWLSTFILLPLGIFFTYRATTDRALISFGALFSKLKVQFNKKEN